MFNSIVLSQWNQALWQHSTFALCQHPGGKKTSRPSKFTLLLCIVQNSNSLGHHKRAVTPTCTLPGSLAGNVYFQILATDNYVSNKNKPFLPGMLKRKPSFCLCLFQTQRCSSESCALHVLFGIMCQTAIKQSSFLTGFPPLGSCCKSTGLYTCSSFTSASLYRTVPGLSFTMKVGPKRSEWEIRILRKRMAYMKKREREKHTMSGGGGESLPRLTPQSIRVDAYHMCSQSACFSLHHMVHAKRGLLLLLLCWQRGNTVINNWKVMELRREMMKTFTKFALSNFFQ